MITVSSKLLRFVIFCQYPLFQMFSVACTIMSVACSRSYSAFKHSDKGGPFTRTGYKLSNCVANFATFVVQHRLAYRMERCVPFTFWSYHCLLVYFSFFVMLPMSNVTTHPRNRKKARGYSTLTQDPTHSVCNLSQLESIPAQLQEVTTLSKPDRHFKTCSFL